MVSARRDIRPIVAIYPPCLNTRSVAAEIVGLGGQRRTLARVTKRRADGPPVKRRPTKPTRTRGERTRGILKKLLVLGVVGLLVVTGVFVVLYQTIEIPDENEAFKAQTTFVYY